MPTVALAPTAKFARPEAVAADFSVTTVAAYSMLGVTIVDVDANTVTANLVTAEAAVAEVTVATAASAILLQQRQQPLMSLLQLWHRLPHPLRL
jgi:hypothetical protein